jgi:hypothetical protein
MAKDCLRTMDQLLHAPNKGRKSNCVCLYFVVQEYSFSITLQQLKMKVAKLNQTKAYTFLEWCTKE